jgi:hypothetical protein
VSAALTSIMTVGTRSNALLRAGFVVLAGTMTLLAGWDIVSKTGFAIDIEIPLRAAERWMNGGQPYEAAAFLRPPGFDLPFLYPPFVLPMVAPFLALPREVVWWGWVLLCVAAAVFSCRRLRVPWPAIPFILAWPPFGEGIMSGNVQVILFAAFVALFWRRDAAAPALRPTATDPGLPAANGRATAREEARTGVLAAIIPALKTAQVHAWWYLLTRRPRAALIGLGIVAVVALATLPLTGTGTWLDWVAQVRRASDPNWALAGISLGRYLPAVVAIVAIVGSIVATPFVRGPRPGVWVGLLAVVGAPSLHTYGLLFMFPAMLMIRREFALLAALLIATYTEIGMWLAIAIVVIVSVASLRWQSLAEPEPADERRAARPVSGALVTPAA